MWWFPFATHFMRILMITNAGRSKGRSEMLNDFEIVHVGVRTGPTATLLAFLLEYVKNSNSQKLETLSYAAFGWLVWPLRYIDFWLIERSGAYILANHIYALVRTPVG